MSEDNRCCQCELVLDEETYYVALFHRSLLPAGNTDLTQWSFLAAQGITAIIDKLYRCDQWQVRKRRYELFVAQPSAQLAAWAETDQQWHRNCELAGTALARWDSAERVPIDTWMDLLFDMFGPNKPTD